MMSVLIRRCIKFKSLVALVFLFFPGALLADTTSIFTLDDFYVQILKYHPVARQAALFPEKARQE
jgi:hypothetical protein